MKRTGAFIVGVAACLTPLATTGMVQAAPVPRLPEQAPSTVELAPLADTGYVALAPARLLDTRASGVTVDGQFQGDGLVGATEVVDLTVLDRGGVPATGVAAVALHVTTTTASTRSWIAIYPHGAAFPPTSNLNPVPGQTRSNLVIVPVGDDGKVDLRNANGSIHLIVDVQGWVPSTDTFTGVAPARLLDTRVTTPKMSAGSTRTVQVGGVADIPSSGVGAVALNLTAVNATTKTFLSIYPGGTARPATSNLNTVGEPPSANLVIVPLGEDGTVTVYNALGEVDAVVDVLGWFPEGPNFTPIAPERVADTRPGDPLGAGETLVVDADLVPGVPSGGVGSLVFNLTSLNSTAATWLTAFPTGAPVPFSSNSNPRTTVVTANLVIAKVSADGEVSIRNANGTIDVLVDVVGWFPSEVEVDDDTLTVTEDDAATLADVLANDVDHDGRPLLIESVDQPAHGTVEIAGSRDALTYAPDADYCNDPAGVPDTFTYHLFGGMSATVAVAVTCVDDMPVAVADTRTVDEDSAATVIDVLVNDTDVDGGTKDVASATQPAHGVVGVSGNTVDYTPTAEYCGEDSFTYTLNGGSTATVTLTVTCVDDVPAAVDDGATVAEDAAATAIGVLANDTDIDGGPITVESVTQPPSGTVVITGSGEGLTYQPAADTCNTPPGTTLDTFTYTLAPGGSTATVSVTVNCVDDAPGAEDDIAMVAEDASATPLNVLANDVDIDAGPKTVASVTQPSNGTVTIAGDGLGVLYEPDANYCNSPPGTTPDTFTYTVAPGGSTATVSVAVTCVDDAPVAVDDAATLAEDDAATSLDVLANDTDIDGGPRAVASVTQPSNGTVTIAVDGLSVSYQPDENYCNTPPGTTLDTFTYTLAPGGSTATVEVTVACVDDMPEAVADEFDVTEDDEATSFDVLSNDTDVDGGPKVVTSVGNPAGGTAVVANSGADISYTPDADFCGDDTFTYSITGGQSTTVTVHVACVDDASVATNDAATVAEDAAATNITVRANDSDIDSAVEAVASVGDPASGSAALASGGLSVDYTPDPDFCGTDTFSYTLTGGSSATVTVTVTCVDDAPTANDDTITIDEDSNINVVPVMANDDDVDGGPMSISGNSDPAHGTVSMFEGTLRYTPDANYCNMPPGTTLDTFTYTLAPGGSTATVTVTVDCADDYPTAEADEFTVAEDSVDNELDVLANDTDIDAGPLLVVSVGDPMYGSAAIVPAGVGILYTPDADACGTDDIFTYEVSGGSMATITVHVTCIDDAPAAVPDLATVTEDSGATTIDVLPNDTDIDGGPLTVASVADPVHGTAINNLTSISYSPDTDYCGSDSFSYTLNGGSTALVTITVTCVDDAAVANPDAASVGEDDAATAIDVLANDTDVESDPIVIDSVTQPANGTVVITGLGTGLTYEPDLDYCGAPTDDFTYTLVGGSTAGVQITVVCDDIAPTAVDDTAGIGEDFGALGIDVLDNDTDPDGGPIAVDTVTQPAHGEVTVAPLGASVVYVPDPEYCGTDTFTYTLAPGSDEGSVTVTVTCIDDDPVAVNNSALVAEDSGQSFLNVLSNDSDIDGGTKLIASATQPANGTVAISPDNTILSYTPDPNYCNNPPGSTLDTFTYTLTPGGSTATVAVTVTCVEDNPTAVDDSVTVLEDSGATTVTVLVNDTDVDGGPKSVASVSQPAVGGSTAISGGGTGVSFTTAANYCGVTTFGYTLTPGGSAATVTVTVTCVDDPPVAVNDSAAATPSAAVIEDAAAAAVTVMANDTDIDLGPMSIASASDPANGTVLITGGGTGLTYKPDANYCNTQPGGSADTFTYTLSPGSSTATVSMTVACVDDPPVAVVRGFSAAANMRIDVPASAGLLVGASDVDGPGPLSVGTVSVTNPTGAVLDVTTATGAFSFTPPPGYTGGVTFTYTVCDSTTPTAVCSAPATVTVSVSGPVVWFLDDSAAAGGNGTLDRPFRTITDLHNRLNVPTAVTGTQIFVYSGNYDGSLTLPASTRIVGQSYDLGISFDSEFGITPPAYLQARPAFEGSSVTIIGSLTLGNSSLVRSLRLAPTSGTALIGSSVTGVDVRVNVEIDAVGAQALNLNGVAGTLDFDSVSSTGGAATGISLTGVTASFVVRDGAVSGTTGEGIAINGGGSNLEFWNGFVLGPIAAGRTLRVENRTSGSDVTFNGPISATGGTGILLSNNDTGSRTFLKGTVTLSTGSNAAITGTNGGRVATSPTATANSITTTSGAAINLSNTTIGTDGLVFRSINVSSASSSGIVLNNTGSLGGLRVIGTGATDSGGVINGGSVGISLTNTMSPSFDRIKVQNTTGSGISGTGVTNFTLTNSTVNNSGTGLGADTSNVAFNSSAAGTESNLSGTVTITGNTLTNAYYHGVDVKNFSGTISSLTISTNTITSGTTTATSQGTGIRVQALGSASTASSISTASIINNTVRNFPLGGGILLQGGNAGAGGAVTMGSVGSPLAITGNQVAGLSAAVPMNTHAIAVVVAGNGTGFFTVSDNGTVANPLTNTTGHVMLLAVNGNLADGTFTVSNNVINGGNLGFGSNGISGGTGPGADGATATPVMAVTATGNSVTNTNGDAILLVARSAAGSLRATLQNNTAQVAAGGAGYGIRVDAGNGSSTGDKVCLALANNIAAGAGGSTKVGVRLHPTGSPPNQFQIVGLSPSPASPAQLQAYLAAQNPGMVAADVTVINSPAGSPFSSCT